MINFIPFLIALIIISCQSTPEHSLQSQAPDWARGPTRTVDNGYIVYVGSGEDSTAERAQFKAEGAALQDLANECSFIPKGARIEDRYNQVEVNLHESYAKVGIEFQVCEEAKKTTDPEHLRKLANTMMTEQIKKYQEMMNEQPQVEDVAQAQEETSGAGSAAPIHDNFHFFIARQQIMYAKEVVILSPPTAYVASAPETQKYLTAVSGHTDRVNNYVQQNPEILKSAHTWSTQRPQLQTVFRQRNYTPGKMYSAPKPMGGTPPPKGGGKRRRRR